MILRQLGNTEIKETAKGRDKRSIEKVRKRETEIDEHEGGNE